MKIYTLSLRHYARNSHAWKPSWPTPNTSCPSCRRSARRWRASCICVTCRTRAFCSDCRHCATPTRSSRCCRAATRRPRRSVSTRVRATTTWCRRRCTVDRWAPSPARALPSATIRIRITITMSTAVERIIIITICIDGLHMQTRRPVCWTKCRRSMKILSISIRSINLGVLLCDELACDLSLCVLCECVALLHCLIKSLQWSKCSVRFN